MSGFVFAQSIPDGDFLRRGEIQVAVVGNHLYIEGGEVSRKSNGQAEDAKMVNNTYSIPLDSAWTNKTVALTETNMNDTLSPVKFFSLWTDDQANPKKMYRWGGEGPQMKIFEEARNPRLGLFSPDGNGGGSWATEDLPKPRMIARVTGASSTSCNGVGFSLGGWGNPGTDRDIFRGNVPVPGLITYDMSSGSWANESALPFSTYGTHAWGSAVCLPSLGSSSGGGGNGSSVSGRPGGLVFFLGGDVTGPTFAADASDANPESALRTDGDRSLTFDKIAFYDQGAKKWHSQTATGDLPPPRRRFCAVAASSAGSHEIIVYGGANPLQTGRDQGFGDVHVLTIPGFRWFKVEGAATARRQGHACAVVPGKKLMVSVGGWDDKFEGESWKTADPWTKGIGVLDLSSLRWLDRYDPAAGAYESPAVVRDWYKDGQLASVKWDNEDTKNLFAMRGGTPGTETIGSDGSYSGNGRINVGAVAGGVVGGVVLLGLAGALAFFLLRRRKQRRQQSPQELPNDELRGSPKNGEGSVSDHGQSPPRSHELLSPNGASELSSPTGVSELHSATHIYEAHGNAVMYEMDGHDRRHEMSAR
ncbi:hypothetical protein MGG_12441 [Pyricularia oryzae 70-15]|uniref:Kelch repeat protein n=2 Tax=Pyricularia oryzae TaxID=318829 RepID=G4MVY0_PYRO7|nr:uncharacterized protein MGG_12441 [Pyricularia oryzae 70-15]EHA55848.1 hypothetical protein MGG_12441 [Pyricularia oryzae 70-15]